MYASFWSKHISELRNPHQPVERHEVCLSSRERALKKTTGSVLQPWFMADPHTTMLCPDSFAILYPRMMRTGFATMGPNPSAAKTSTSTSTRSSSAHDRRSQTSSAAIKSSLSFGLPPIARSQLNSSGCSSCSSAQLWSLHPEVLKDRAPRRGRSGTASH